MLRFAHLAALSALAAAFPVSPAPAEAPKRLAATYLGTPAADRIEDVTIAEDGTIYVAGWLGTQRTDWPEGTRATVLGKPDGDSRYGCGFVAKVSPDGRKLLAMTTFAKGIAKCTSVAIGAKGVYVGGYATESLEGVIGDFESVLAKADPRPTKLDLHTPSEHWTMNRYPKSIDQRGTPFVVRLDADLSALSAGTFLEGWEGVWHVPRPLGENFWQPVDVAVLSDGDVAVSHDGGYNRIPADGSKPGLADFYDVPDHLSRLSGDLSKRRWHEEVYTPPVDPAKARKYFASRSVHWRPTKLNWTDDHLSNPRIMRLRADAENNIYIAGWTPGRTSAEPWWTPFLWKLSGSGEVVLKAYSPSPLSGGGDRLGGVVADTAMRTVAPDGQGGILFSGISDGGNSVLNYDPRDYGKGQVGKTLRGSVWGFQGRMLFWGTVGRLDGKTGELRSGERVAGFVNRGRRGKPQHTAAWVTDVAPLGEGGVLAVGRHTKGFDVTDDAWDSSARGAFVRVYDKDFKRRFSTSVPDGVLLSCQVKGTRAVIVGEARSAHTPTVEAFQPEFAGGADGYLLVVEVTEGD